MLRLYCNVTVEEWDPENELMLLGPESEDKRAVNIFYKNTYFSNLDTRW